MKNSNKPAIIEVKNLSFSYGKTRVLSDINLKIEKGDFVGLIGPNGSGKTTLLKLILGLLPLKQGNIRIMGTDIFSFKDWHLIGYVSQKATNIEEGFPATVSEVVSMGLLSMKKFPKMISKKDQNLIDSSLRLVGMEKFANKRIGELSGGQQQRVLIAKAIISNPEILFLDEPTTGIDVNSQIKFYSLLSKLNKKGITIILVSHDISRITRYVTKIASLNQRLEFYGSHNQFCSIEESHSHECENHHICLGRG